MGGAEEFVPFLPPPRSLDTDCRSLPYICLLCVQSVADGVLASFEVSLGFQFGCGERHGADCAIAPDRFDGDLMT